MRLALEPLRRVLVVENPHPSLDERLRAAGMEVVRHDGAAPDEDELIALLRRHDAQVLCKRSRVPVSRRVVEAAPSLFLVQLCSIGTDSVDLQAAADHGVIVCNDPVSNGRSVVELALGQLLALARRLYETDRACRAGTWDKTTAGRYELRGKVLGVLGLGRIGRATARAAEALGMRVRFHDTAEVAREVGIELGFEPVDEVEALFAGSDCVTVHLSSHDAHGRSNAGILTRERLMALGRDRGPASPRLFVNLSRGFLFDPADLLAAVRAGAIRRAAVDVYPSEPRGGEPWTNPYADEPRVAVTPHIGASTLEAQPRIARRVAATVTGFAREGRLRDCVFAPRLTLAPSRPEPVVLAVGHAALPGTKAAVDEAIYQAGASNLESAHLDFDTLGMAYEVVRLDRPLGRAAIEAMAAEASRRTGRPDAIRSVRQVVAAATPRP